MGAGAVGAGALAGMAAGRTKRVAGEGAAAECAAEGVSSSHRHLLSRLCIFVASSVAFFLIALSDGHPVLKALVIALCACQVLRTGATTTWCLCPRREGAQLRTGVTGNPCTCLPAHRRSLFFRLQAV